MKLKYKVLFAGIFTALLFAACAEKPNTKVGNNLIDPSLRISVFDTTITSSNDTTYVRALVPGSGASNLIGRTTTNEDVLTMLNFQTFASDFDSLNGATIDTAMLRLTVNYRWNISAAPITFNVFEILRSWSYATFSSDSLTAGTIGTQVLATFSDSMNYGKTIASTLLDTSTVRRMINSFLYPDSIKFNGFAVQAVQGTTPGIVGFITFTAYSTLSPTLTIIYTRNGVKDSLVLNYGFDTFSSKFTTPPPTTPIEVHGGFGIRSSVRFDLSSLKNKPIINNAIFEITLNKALSHIEGFSPDTISLYIRSNAQNPDSIYSAASWLIYGIKKDTSLLNTVYTCNVTPFVQRWVNSTIVNNGFNIRWAAETSSAEKAVFYSSTEADSSKRPTLKLVFSK